jgi:hypothetical protein
VARACSMPKHRLTSHAWCPPAAKKVSRNPPSMAEKMVRRAISLGGGMHSIVKWRTSRSDISCRPPPGGPHAAHSVRPSISFQKSFLRS